MWWAMGRQTTGGTGAKAVDIGEIIRRARRYDRDAFAALYDCAVTPVYRYLAARLDGPADAEELTQEVFIAALAGIENLRASDEPALMAWLFQIARHKLADYLRRRYRRPVTDLDEAEAAEDPAERPEEAAEVEEERAALRQALAALTPEQREVILCKYILDYDNQRTAQILGKNTNAVNQLHHRALASLQRMLTRPEKAG